MKDNQERPKKISNIVKFVYNDIVCGAPNSVLLEKLMSDSYSIGKKYKRSQSYKIIAKASELIKDDFSEYRESAKQQLFATALDILTECREMKDRSNALKTLDYISKLIGAYEADKINIKEEKDVTIDFKFG